MVQCIKAYKGVNTCFKRGSPKDKGAFDLHKTSIIKEIKQGRFQCDISLHSLPRRLQKNSEWLVHSWSTYSVCDFGLGASDGPVKGQESSESSS